MGGFAQRIGGLFMFGGICAVGIPLLLWLISTVLLRNRAQTPVFWALALLSSALEPLGLYGDYLAVVPPGLFGPRSFKG